jgi:hypothetical protein
VAEQATGHMLDALANESLDVRHRGHFRCWRTKAKETTMFVVFTQIAVKGYLRDWADPSKFPALFDQSTMPEGRWSRSILVDDDSPAEFVKLKVDANRAYIFYAKDKETLKDGLRVPLPSSTITAERGQLAVYSGSYDFEKTGAWASNKMQAADGWQAIKDEGRKEGYTAQGLGKSDFVTYFNRQRLLKRGHFMIAAEVTQMVGIRKLHSFIGASERMIRSLPHFVE